MAYDFSGSQQWGPLYTLGGQSPSLLSQSHGGMPSIPEPMQQQPWDHSSPYLLTMKQQPQRAKAANAKDKDRKPIDPPPILQLDVDPSEDPYQVYITSPYLFVQTFLLGASDSDPEPDLNSLTGNTCTSGHVVKDDRGIHNMMFCLNDISVKKEGTYRLRFCLFKLNTTTGEVENLTSIVSQPFTTYNGRHFPGMSESTPMTRLLVDAGVRLRLRKESKAMSTKKRNNSFAQMMSRRGTVAAADNDDDDGGDRRPVKRMRSESNEKDSTIPYSAKHGSFSTTHSYTTAQTTPTTSMAPAFSTAFHPVPSSPSPTTLGPMYSSSSALQLGLDTQVGNHYSHHAPPSSVSPSSYQSPTRQSPTVNFALHGHGTTGTASSQGGLVAAATATSPLAHFTSGGGAQGHGGSSPDLNYTTSAHYHHGAAGGYMPSSVARTLPTMQQHHPAPRSNSVVGAHHGGLAGLRLGLPGLQSPHGGLYGDWDSYGYATRDGP